MFTIKFDKKQLVTMYVALTEYKINLKRLNTNDEEYLENIQRCNYILDKIWREIG